MLRFYKLKIYDFIFRFSGANVVVTAPKKTKGGRELQLASMSALTSKASSQHFFLRILKVIIQGDPLNPENYRPITLLSCLGKLFTAVLNDRLSNYLDENLILNENQAGFRKHYSTSDHIFALHSIFELLRLKQKKLYCAFVDFSKAFDSVWRVGLWNKLLENEINGKCFNVIYNLYQNIKSCISLNGNRSLPFESFIGLRQGENLSPALFFHLFERLGALSPKQK